MLLMDPDKLLQYLNNVSLYYLSRYSSSSKNLNNFLLKKVKKKYAPALKENNDLIHLFQEKIDQTVNKMENMGYINDTIYTSSTCKKLIISGKSLNYIKIKLKQKGIENSLIEQTLTNIETDSVELFGALKYIKKRRFGCFDNSEQDNIKYQKQFNALCRQGFPIDVVKKVLSFTKEQIEEVEDLYYNLSKNLNI